MGKLLSLFPRADCDPLLAEQFDRVFRREMEEVRDFLILHYHHSAGRDEPMWRHVQAATLPDTLAYKLDHFRRSGRIMLSPEELFRDASWFAVLTGQGVEAEGYTPLLDGETPAQNRVRLHGLRAAIDRSAGRYRDLR